MTVRELIKRLQDLDEEKKDYEILDPEVGRPANNIDIIERDKSIYIYAAEQE